MSSTDLDVRVDADRLSVPYETILDMNEPALIHGDGFVLHTGQALDVLRTMDAGSVNCCVTSPPYFGLRDYGVDGQIGAEKTPAEYVANLLAVFAEMRRVLAHDGTFWLNLGDGYDKGNLLGMPWRVAHAAQADGWVLRNAIVWTKPNAMPESVTNRMSKKYEMIFLFTKSQKYWFNLDPIREVALTANRTGARGSYPSGNTGYLANNEHRLAPGMGAGGLTQNPLGKNPGDVWSMATSPFAAAHFATFPPELPRRCILSGCKPGGTVLDPFHGSGTTGMVARELGREYVGIDLSAEYIELSLATRLRNPR